MQLMKRESGFLRVLHVIPGLANSSGPTHVVVNLAEHLAKLGCWVTVYYMSYPGIKPLLPDGALVETRASPLTFSRRWGYSKELGRALSENIPGFDIVHITSVWMYPTTAAARACRKHDVPYVMRPAGSFEPWCLQRSWGLKKAYYWLVERRNLANAAVIQAMSDQERLHFRDLGFDEKVVVIPNGVSSDCSGGWSGAQFREQFGIHEDTPLVLFLSRVHPKKGLDILTAAFALVLRKLPEARLVVAGPAAPGYGIEVQRMLEAQGIDAHTILTGELRGEEKWAAYRAADVFVLPSRSENFGIVVAEAMACGVPVVVSRETPWQDVETYNAGRWVKLDPDEIAENIIEILENRELARKMGQNGRALVRKKYTWDRIAEKMLSVYENIVAGRDPDERLGGNDSSVK